MGVAFGFFPFQTWYYTATSYLMRSEMWNQIWKQLLHLTSIQFCSHPFFNTYGTYQLVSRIGQLFVTIDAIFLFQTKKSTILLVVNSMRSIFCGQPLHSPYSERTSSASASHEVGEKTGTPPQKKETKLKKSAPSLKTNGKSPWKLGAGKWPFPFGSSNFIENQNTCREIIVLRLFQSARIGSFSHDSRLVFFKQKISRWLTNSSTNPTRSPNCGL